MNVKRGSGRGKLFALVEGNKNSNFKANGHFLNRFSRKHEKLISDTSAQAEHLRIAVQTFRGHFQRCNYFHKFFNTMSTDLMQCNCRSSSRLSNREKIRRHSVFPDEFNVSYCSISKLSPL
ncbi:hypothetical protein T01_5479 [Trichinella spiralis]|uniref:Uncharacterized protein n=1 Tax=Trichinella spiralis TaxID=6334 RepID=A0A0V1C159_TRISP|nr:hypothetical protein T01_5479 [Trichinella spiralis]